jgi:hypothetical protein
MAASMTPRTGSFENTFFVRWDSSPTPAALAELLPKIHATHKQTGKLVAFLTIVQASAPVPSSEERKALEQFASDVKPFVEHAYLVIEGDGFKASIQRSVIIGLTFFKDRGFTTIYKTVDEGLRAIAQRTHVGYAELAAGARSHAL